MRKNAPPTDAFMGMLDLAWQDFKTYREKGDDSTPRGLAIVLVGTDSEGLMTIKTGANIPPIWVEAALVLKKISEPRRNGLVSAYQIEEPTQAVLPARSE